MQFDDIFTDEVSTTAMENSFAWLGDDDVTKGTWAFSQLPMPMQDLIIGFSGTSFRHGGALLVNNALEYVIQELASMRNNMHGEQYTMERMAISTCISIVENSKVV